MTRFRASVSVLALSIVILAGKAHADIIADANGVLLDAIKEERLTPPLAARALAIFHQAAASAVSYTDEGDVSDDEKRVRTLGALLQVGESEFPKSRSRIQHWVPQAVPQSVSAEARLRALRLGRESARAVLAERRKDLAIAQLPDSVSTAANTPGFPVWAPPPRTAALHPHWGLVTPIVLSRDDLPLLPSPSTTDSDAFQIDLFETFLYGGHHSNVRSESERIAAVFWAQNGGSVTPPGQWNAIAQSFSRRAKLSLKTETTLFSLLNIALFDASIACWRNKYH